MQVKQGIVWVKEDSQIVVWKRSVQVKQGIVCVKENSRIVVWKRTRGYLAILNFYAELKIDDDDTLLKENDAL